MQTPEDAQTLQGVIDAVVRGTPGLEWSICVRRDGVARAESAPGALLPTASLGKVFLLTEVARRIEHEPAFARRLVDRRSFDAVEEAGLWQSLTTDALPVADLACLAAAVSDNLATNALLATVSLDAVRSLTETLGLRGTALLDRVRRVRTAGHAPHLSIGSAGDFAVVFERLAEGTLVTPAVSARVRDWLARNMDLSLVASAFDLDPLVSHAPPPLALFNKTGSDAGTRAEAGCVTWRGLRTSYAVVVRYEGASDDARSAASVGIRSLGAALRRDLE